MTDWKALLNEVRRCRAIGRTENAISVLATIVEALISAQIKTDPPVGKQRVTNLYVDNGKLRVEYEEE